MRYSAKKYAQALYESSKGKSSSESDKVAKAFLALLDHYHDRSLLARIVEQYEKIRRQQEGITKVEAITAKKLSGQTKSEIEKKFNGKVEIGERVHPEVLGGIKLIINDEYQIDGTMQGRVEKLYKVLMAGAEK
jgi:F0F1-type ATP synthase delta subunit